MRKTSKWAVALVCALVAFMLMVQYKSVLFNSSTGSTTLARAEELQAELTKEREKNEALYEQVLTYKGQVDEYSRQAEESGGHTKILSQQLEQASILAGLTAVRGPGVTVTMEDSTVTNNGNVNESYFIIHDEDVMRAVNELRDAGAEAISINGERLISTSEIRCSGSVISVNNNRYASPFVIKAIGAPEELYNALTMRGGVVEVLGEWGITVDVKKETSLEISAYTGSTEFKYAEAAKE